MPASTASANRPSVAHHPRIADIRDLLTFRIAMLAAANDRMGQSWLKNDFGLRVLEWRVLGLTVALGPVRFGTIARRLLLDKGQLSRLVKALVQRGLVSTRTDDEDQRTLRLTPTAGGRALHDRVLSKALARNELIASALTAEETATLFALFDKLQPFMDHRVDEVEATAG